MKTHLRIGACLLMLLVGAGVMAGRTDRKADAARIARLIEQLGLNCIETKKARTTAGIVSV